MRLAASLLVACAAAGCTSAASAIYLTVDSTQPIAGVDHFHIVVTSNGRDSQPVDLALTGRPLTLPPPHSVQLRFPGEPKGPATIHLDAADAAGKSLAHGVVTADIDPGKETLATLLLGADLVTDGGMPDRSTPDMGKAIAFAPAKSYGTGSFPVSVATGDFNGDNRTDLVVANLSSNDLSVLMGKGDGTFETAVMHSAGLHPLTIAVGDWNRDRKPDLVVTNEMPGATLFQGDGTGGFVASHSLAIIKSGWVVPQDINRDGNLDLLITSQFNNVGVFFGIGDGTFQNPIQTAFAGAQAFVSGDLNGDAHDDLIVTYSGNMANGYAALLGDGLGSFKPAGANFSTSYIPTVAVLRDLNGDDHLDLVIGNDEAKGPAVRFGNGNGTFQSEKVYTVGDRVTVIGMADFDGDGVPDIAAGTTTAIVILAGRGDGTFNGPMTSPIGAAAGFGAIADFNGDGQPDLAVAVNLASSVFVLINVTR